jgi:hypothetical protein
MGQVREVEDVLETRSVRLQLFDLKPTCSMLELAHITSPLLLEEASPRIRGALQYEVLLDPSTNHSYWPCGRSYSLSELGAYDGSGP